MRRTVAMLVLLASLILAASAQALLPAPTLKLEGTVLRWTKVEGATEYRLGYKPKGEGEWPGFLAGTKGTACGTELCFEFEPKAFTEGAEWEVRVQSWKPATKESEWSNVVIDTPHPKVLAQHLGKVKYRAETGKSGKISSWDSYDLAEWEPWVEKHVPYLKAYPSLPAKSSTRWLNVGLPSSTIIQGYWDWPAEEAEGGPFAPLTAARREAFVKNRAEGTITAGYDGVWLDDVNWHTGYRDQKQSTTFEPEFKEELELVKAIRTSVGAGKLLTINSQFFDVEEDVLGLAGTETERKTIREAYEESDLAAKEFGTSNIESATSYKRLFEWVSYLHEHGTQVEMLPTNTEESANAELFRKEHQFNLATYLLFNAQATNLKTGRQALGGDFVGGKEMTPMPGGNTNASIAGSLKPESGKFWRGYELDLGTPVSGEEGKYKREASGLWVRKFSGGIVYALEPGAAETEAPALPRELEKIDGTKLASGSKPKLKAAEGLVLIG